MCVRNRCCGGTEHNIQPPSSSSFAWCVFLCESIEPNDKHCHFHKHQFIANFKCKSDKLPNHETQTIRYSVALLGSTFFCVFFSFFVLRWRKYEPPPYLRHTQAQAQAQFNSPSELFNRNRYILLRRAQSTKLFKIISCSRYVLTGGVCVCVHVYIRTRGHTSKCL